MWFTAIITVLITFAIGLSVAERVETMHLEPELLNHKNLKAKGIDEQINVEHLLDQMGSTILDEQLKWLDNQEVFNKDLDDTASLQDSRTVFDEMLIPIPAKKSGGTSRLCGTKLVDAIVKLCNGCVKPAGGKAVSAKRSLTSLIKRAQTLTEKCCINRCSFDDMKSFCCD